MEWKDDASLRQFLQGEIEHPAFVHKRSDNHLLYDVARRFPQYKWSRKKLTVCLQVFGISISDEVVMETVKRELQGPAKCRGIESMWHRLRQDHRLYVTKEQVYQALKALDPEGIQERKHRRKKKSREKCWGRPRRRYRAYQKVTETRRSKKDHSMAKTIRNQDETERVAAAWAMDNPVAIEWKEHGQKLASGMWSLLKESFMVDTDLMFGNDRYRIHRLVLAIFLPAFRQCMDLRMESLVEDGDDLETIIEFMYTGKLIVSQSRVERLRRLADVLNFDGLAKAIREISPIVGNGEVEESEETETDQDTSGDHFDDHPIKQEKEDSDSTDEWQHVPESQVSPVHADGMFDPTRHLAMLPWCENCNKSFVTRDSFVEHECPNVPACSKRSLGCVQTMSELDSPSTAGKKSTVADSKSPLHVCQYCGKYYASSDGLLRHIEGHNRASDSCYVCGYDRIIKDEPRTADMNQIDEPIENLDTKTTHNPAPTRICICHSVETLDERRRRLNRQRQQRYRKRKMAEASEMREEQQRQLVEEARSGETLEERLRRLEQRQLDIRNGQAGTLIQDVVRGPSTSLSHGPATTITANMEEETAEQRARRLHRERSRWYRQNRSEAFRHKDAQRQAARRANQGPIDIDLRKQLDREHHANRLQIESLEQSIARRAKNAAAMKDARARATDAVIAERQTKDRERYAATIRNETPQQAIRRRARNAARQRKVRANKTAEELEPNTGYGLELLSGGQKEPDDHPVQGEGSHTMDSNEVLEEPSRADRLPESLPGSLISA